MDDFADIAGDDDEYVLSGTDLVGYGIDPAHVGRRRKKATKANRAYVCPLTPLTLGAAGAGTLVGTPNLPFRPDRLVLVDSVANNSTITSVSAGNVNMFCGNTGSAPAAGFSPIAVGVRFVGQSVPSNTQINVAAALAAAGTLSGFFTGLADQ
jgi:hypothetical protein